MCDELKDFSRIEPVDDILILSCPTVQYFILFFTIKIFCYLLSFVTGFSIAIVARIHCVNIMFWLNILLFDKIIWEAANLQSRQHIFKGNQITDEYTTSTKNKLYSVCRLLTFHVPNDLHVNKFLFLIYYNLGIVLQWLRSSPTLESITHLVLDEVGIINNINLFQSLIIAIIIYLNLKLSV